jgi:hypothetical protein
MAPGCSARDLFGAELRSWRRRNDFSHASLAQSVHCSASLIGRIEKSDRWPSQDLAVACDTVLGTGGTLARLWPAVEEQRRQEAANHQPAPDPVGQTADDPGGSDRRFGSDPAGDVSVVLLPAGGGAAGTWTWPHPPGLAAAAGFTYGRVGGAVPYSTSAGEQAGVGVGVQHEVVMTAHGSSEHAEHAERREIGEATLEQLRAEITRLALDFGTYYPLVMFGELRRVRDRIHAALERRLWPRDQTELYFLLGCAHNLLAIAAKFLGFPQAGEELLRAGWAYASVIDHRPLMARLRMELAAHAQWQSRPRQCRALAASGLDYLADGPDAAALHLLGAQAAAQLGDADAARRAITAAHEASEREQPNELLDIGGEFRWSRAAQHYMSGATLVEIPAATHDAVAELERATDLYAAGPAPGEAHGFEYTALAHIDLAAAQLHAGALDAAAAALEPALSLPPAQRVNSLSQRLHQVRRELAAPAYRGQTSVADLDERIEDFTRQTLTADLAGLTGTGH